GHGAALDLRLAALYGEGGGGGGARESYELFAYFLATRCETPRAERPWLILYGDEGFYEKVVPTQVRGVLGFELDAPVSSKDVWRELAERFEIFFLRKKYVGEEEAKILLQWKAVLGTEQILLCKNKE